MSEICSLKKSNEKARSCYENIEEELSSAQQMISKLEKQKENLIQQLNESKDRPQVEYNYLFIYFTPIGFIQHGLHIIKKKKKQIHKHTS
jgi:hypothetical protein